MQEFQKTTKKLANKSLEFLRKEFDENNMSNHKDNLIVIPNRMSNRYTDGFTIAALDDDVIMFNEFGTGVVGQGTSPLADFYGYKYNVGPKIGQVPDSAVRDYMIKYGFDEEEAREILEAQTTPNTWWYYKNGIWHKTQGMRAKNMFANLQYELLKSSRQDYAMVINSKLKKE